MRKRVFILGVLCGLLGPYIGIFLGLQVSAVLGNIFAFPIITVSFVTGIPFGMWGGELWLLAILFSIILWTAIWAGIDQVIRRR